MTDGFPGYDAVRDRWAAKADSWVGNADILSASADRMNAPLLEAADLHPGHHVLDLASGAGEPALTAARSVGSQGSVVASDLIVDMLRGIRHRDDGRQVSLIAADMQRLPFASGTFDRVTCRFGLMFVPDPVAAMRSVSRVLRAGGKAAFMVWGPFRDQTLFVAMASAVEQVLGQEPDSHFRQIYSLSSPEHTSTIFNEAGLRNVAETSQRSSAIAPLDKPFWRAPLSITFGHLVDELPPDTQNALDTAMRDELAPVRESDGYRLSSHARIVTGIAP